MVSPWRIVAHTADLAIEASGPTEGAALDAAALALTHVLTEAPDPHGLGSDTEIQFVLEAPDHESLLVAFLSELLWLADSEGLLWTGGGIQIAATDDGLWRATATGNGVVHDPNRHGRGSEVKAVTYHDLHSGQVDGAWSVRVLLDI